jgi:predicted phage tail protein
MKKKITLLGELGKKFGRTHYFDVKTTSEAIRALCANFKGFRKHLIDSDKNNVGYKILFKKGPLMDEKECFDPIGAKDEIKILPVIAGADSGTGKIIGGVLLIAIGAVLTFTPLAAASPYIIAAGVSLTLGGIVQLLTPLPKAPKPPERQEDKAGYIFNGAVNTTVQGFPVPVGYGRLIVGSAIISAGITVEDIIVDV